MENIRITVNPDYTVGETDKRLFGSFVEQFGRVVYGGIFEPDGKYADDMGFRRDVIELVRELGVSCIRYPGGNMVSDYKWEDGVGPVANRPATFNAAWKEVDTNRIGIDEFADYCQKTDSEFMMAVNLATAGLSDAKNIIEYCNYPGGTKYSDMRIKNGHPEAHNVRTWFLGNEMDGHWQIGRTTAEEYAWRAKEAAKIMRRVDPNSKFVLCGSSLPDYPAYPVWDRTVMELTYNDAEYISLHSYYRNEDGDTASYLASDESFDSYIRGKIATCDYVKAKLRSKRTMMLSFDEYNVSNSCPVRYEKRGLKMPLLEGNYGTIYNVEDAITLGGLLISLLTHADRVKIACIAQLVNAIAPIAAVPGKPAWRQTIFYPFLHFSKYGRGTVLNTLVKSPKYECKLYGEVDTVKSVAVLGGDNNDELTIFAVNKSLDEDADIVIDAQKFNVKEVISEIEFGGCDGLMYNGVDNPDNVMPHKVKKAIADRDKITTRLAPLSWNVIRLKVHAEV
ncbi:MAG: alpha-N-arabinofuranosidase [Eubacteriales bacterium]